jgi:hypothetical protein
MMYRRAHRHLDGFQVWTPRLALLREDEAQQLIYFARDLLLNPLGRFFPAH